MCGLNLITLKFEMLCKSNHFIFKNGNHIVFLFINYIIEKSRPNKVVLTMPLESLMDENIIDALKHHFGNKMDGLSHYQIITLALAYSEEEITNEKLQHVLDIHRADITNMLSKMCSQQLLDSYGYGRGK